MPQNSEFPQEVKNFLWKYIHSVEEMEVLLMLMDSTERMWPVREIQKYIQSDEISIAKTLEELKSHGFLKSEKMPGLVYQFAPQNNELHQGVSSLKSAYKNKRIQVLQFICQRSENELLNFSNAFKIRRSENDS